MGNKPNIAPMLDMKTKSDQSVFSERHVGQYLSPTKYSELQSLNICILINSILAIQTEF